jgi:sigma-B regulation protein RsbU (phosphoserine phosphatase)
MNGARHTALREILRFLFLALAIVFLHAFPLVAQTPSQPPANAAVAITSADLHAVVNIEGAWRFQIGDDPRWADPAFDDTNWPTVVLSQSLTLQGYPTYAGYAWYRIHLGPQQWAQFVPASSSEPFELLVTGDSVGQLAVYVNGVESGQTRGMTDTPQMYESPPMVAQLSPPDASGSRVIAIRTWAGSDVTIGRGLLTRVELGPQHEIADRLAASIGAQWNEHAASAIMLAFLYLCVAMLGAALFLAQRHHSEYLWLALLCVTVAIGGAADAIFGLGIMPYSVFRILARFHGCIFLAVMLEFVLHFTATRANRVQRAFQITVLLLPIFSVLQFEHVYEILVVVAEIVFCAMASLLLYRAWRRGLGEAGVMLLPFFLAAAGDSIETLLDVAAGNHLIPQYLAPQRYHLGPVEYGTNSVAFAIFLASLVAVILYRFIHVSEVEQRSSAEIAAARSVQALLIPTQLPSNKNFMLESAYLPVNGVGGDFFQVLPLKDDSLLIVVGDVSGKGLQAAMNSSTLVGALRNELSHDPATVLDHLNHVLLGAVSSPGAVPGLDSAPCFATCLCARIYSDGTMTVANAGHLSPYRDGRELELPPGLPLGVIADSHYEQSEFHLNRGDRLVFLSDGVVEATNPEGELFGFERTQQVSNEPARYIAQTAQRFGQTDDITVVSLYVASRAAERNSEKALHTS